MSPAKKKTALLAVSGSVAAYKACEIASQLTQKGLRVRVALTPRAAQLVSPILFRAITGEPAAVDEFSTEAPAPMTHIEFSACDLFLAAPASADLIGRLACGLADDLVTSAALALPLKTPRILAPAMNSHMWENPLVRRNLEVLAESGFRVLEPGSGYLACGVEGKGRLADPAEIVRAALQALKLS